MTAGLHKRYIHTLMTGRAAVTKAPRQQEECLPVMKGKRWKKGRKRRRERGHCVTGR